MNKNTFLKFKDNDAVITENDSRYSYNDLLKYAELIGKEVETRSLVFCLSSNSVGSLAGYVSLIFNNSVPVMLDSKIDRGLLNDLISIYKPRYIWLPEEESETIDGYRYSFSALGYSLILNNNNQNCKLHPDLALLLPTSGSTGSPKLVKLTYENIESNAKSIAKYLEIDESDRPITTLPLHYTFGLSIINSHLIKGSTILLTNSSVMEKSFWSFLSKSKATSLSGVPYTFEMLDRLRFFRMELKYLKKITQAGGKLSNSLSEKFSNFFIKENISFYVMYGQTEATARMSYLPPEYSVSKLGSIGVAIPGGEFHLINDNGQLIEKDETVGELVYEGSNVSMGYSITLEDLAKDDTNKGVLKTGDLAKKDKEGFYYIVGRKKRFAKIFGNRVNLDEVEQLVKNITHECACIAVGELICIYTPKEEKINEIKEFISLKTGIHSSGFKVEYIDCIPKNSSGKTIYSRLDK